MADTTWSRVEALFEAALERPPEQRDTYLDAHCDRSAVRHEVKSLLAARDEASGFFPAMADRLVAPFMAEIGEAVVDAEGGSPPTDLVGKEVGSYRVVEAIGGGGMGIVYRAWDPQLERSVALKFLPPVLATSADAQERFRHEARAVARLEHPNVAMIHEIGATEQGHPFIAMAHYDGESLRTRLDRTGPLRVEVAVKHARTIAEALHEIHRVGIVHRDVKPSNVMMTAQGTVKLIDFGLATAAAETGRSGSRLGTPPYMSPEQAGGNEAGPPVDLWALGVMLYEMLTGERPFPGERPPDVFEAIREEEPASLQARRPAVPDALVSIVARCLRKDPEARYASAEALATALRSLGETAEASRAVAVLPFAAREAPDGTPFADGMHESLLTQLSKVSDLKVVGAAATEETDRARSAVADALGVRWVVTGSVWRADDRTQIAVQLTDGRTDDRVWAETYRRDLTAEHLFDVQEQITRKVTEAVKAEVTPGERERIGAMPTRNLEAYRLYVEGRTSLNRRDEGGLLTAVDRFEQAIQEDAGYALAWAGLADALNLFPLYVSDAHASLDREAEPAARRALELAPDLSEANAALGYLQGIPEGIHRLRHAVDLKPSYAQAHQWLALKLLVAGESEAAREHASIAADLAPQNRAAQGFLAFHDIAEGRYQKGLAILKQQTRSFGAEPDWAVDIASRFVFAALYSLDQWQKAQGLVRQRQDAVEQPVWAAEWDAKHGMIEAALGREAHARERADRLHEGAGPLYRGVLLVALGDEDAAYDAFKRVDTWGYYNVVELRYFYPEILESFRQTPRYETLIGAVERRRARNPTAAYEAISSAPDESS